MERFEGLRFYELWTGLLDARHTCDRANFSAGTMLGLERGAGRRLRQDIRISITTRRQRNAIGLNDSARRRTIAAYAEHLAKNRARKVGSRRIPIQRICENSQKHHEKTRQLSGRLEDWYNDNKRRTASATGLEEEMEDQRETGRHCL